MSCTVCYQNSAITNCSVCINCLEYHDEKKIQAATHSVEYYQQEYIMALSNITNSTAQLSEARQIMQSDTENPEYKRRCDLYSILQDINYMWQSRCTELAANVQYTEGRLHIMECENIAVEERKKTK